MFWTTLIRDRYSMYLQCFVIMCFSIIIFYVYRLNDVAYVVVSSFFFIVARRATPRARQRRPCASSFVPVQGTRGAVAIVVSVGSVGSVIVHDYPLSYGFPLNVSFFVLCTPAAYVSLGPCDRICRHCKAHFCYEERLKHGSAKTNQVYLTNA